MSAIAALLATPVVRELIGTGIGRISKTKVGANVAMLAIPDWSQILSGILVGDPASIGKLVLVLGTWFLTLWGRGNKG